MISVHCHLKKTLSKSKVVRQISKCPSISEKLTYVLLQTLTCSLSSRVILYSRSTWSPCILLNKLLISITPDDAIVIILNAQCLIVHKCVLISHLVTLFAVEIYFCNHQTSNNPILPGLAWHCAFWPSSHTKYRLFSGYVVVDFKS